ncbi:MAG: hypothetical protein NUV46_04060 [Nanoarchaeota archaeon]|nr:hypothetical protein [Nanoarchaeota archaeon]
MDKKIVLYIVVGILVLLLFVFTFFPGIIDAVRDSGKTRTEKCAVPAGYTEQDWYEHMSHHPGIYGECLG